MANIPVVLEPHYVCSHKCDSEETNDIFKGALIYLQARVIIADELILNLALQQFLHYSYCTDGMIYTHTQTMNLHFMKIKEVYWRVRKNCAEEELYYSELMSQYSAMLLLQHTVLIPWKLFENVTAVTV